jgi:hypothetical protein
MPSWRYCVACAASLLILVGYLIWSKAPVIAFSGLRDAHARFISAGFHCTSDAIDGQVGSGFVLSREKLGWADAVELRKSGTMGPEWKGRVWVTVNPGFWQIEAIPDDAATRTWGEIVAFGDAELLEEIESSMAEPWFEF